MRFKMPFQDGYYLAAFTLSRINPSMDSGLAGTGGYHLILSISAVEKERLKLALTSAS